MVLYNWELSDSMSIILKIGDNFYMISLDVLTKKKQNTTRVYQDSRPPILTPTPNPFIGPKGNNKFKSNL